jgi:cytidylate kinase
MERFRDPGLTAAAERAMRRWVSTRQSERQAAERSASVSAPRLCITVSREAGARGSTVARLVGQKIGWTVYDQELLEYIAHEVHLRSSVLESLEETEFDWSHDWLANLLEDQWQNQDTYIVHLTKVVLAIGLHGESIIVGRGAACILPRERSLNVRIIAKDSDRISFLSQIERLTPLDAERHMRETDEQRKRFVRDYFHRNNEDVHEYDLVLDSSALGEECCADVIIAALRGKEALARNRQTAKTRPSHVPAE